MARKKDPDGQIDRHDNLITLLYQQLHINKARNSEMSVALTRKQPAWLLHTSHTIFRPFIMNCFTAAVWARTMSGSNQNKDK